MPPWLVTIIPSVIDWVKGLTGVEDPAVKAAKIQSDNALNLKQGDIDIAQAQVNIAVAQKDNWESKWRSILAFGLVGDFLLKNGVTDLTQYIYSLRGLVYDRPVYASDELTVTLLSGLLGLGLMYYRSQDKRALIGTAVQEAIRQHLKSNPLPEAPKGRYNKETDTYEN